MTTLAPQSDYQLEEAVSEILRNGEAARTPPSPDKSSETSDWIQAWQDVDAMLMRWPEEMLPDEEDQFFPPNEKSIGIAREISATLRDAGEPPPMRVVPNGDGGLSIDWRPVPNGLLKIGIEEDGDVELSYYVDGIRQFRKPSFKFS